VTMQDVFAFHHEGMHGDRVVGELRPTGIRPSFADRLTSRGLELPSTLFGYADTR
jgi:pilus assembly protein CpaF